MPILPSRQAAILSVPSASSVSIPGLPSSLNFDGTTDFTIAFWVRIDDVGTSPSLVICPDNLQVYIRNGQVAVAFPTQPSIPAFLTNPASGVNGPNLVSGTWNHIAVAVGTQPQGVGEPDPGSGRVASIFVNGLWAGYEPIPDGLSPIARTGDPTLASGSTNLQFRSLQIFDYGLNEAEVNSLKFNGQNSQPATPPVVGYDFGSVPPELSGSARALSGITQNYVTVGTSYAVNHAAASVPGSGDTPNPANGMDPFSVQTWFFPLTLNPTIPQTVFSNGSGGSAYVQILVVADGNDMKIMAYYGGQSLSVSGYPVNTWTNVGLVYDDVAERFTLYVNGEAKESGPAYSDQTRSKPYMKFGYFPGYIQNVNIWSRALSASEIQQFLMPFNAIDDPSLTGVYDFVNAPISNLITGIPITYKISYDVAPAPIEYISIPASGSGGIDIGPIGPQVEAQQASQVQNAKVENEALAKISSPSGNGGFDRSKIDPSLFNQEKIDQFMTDIQARMPGAWTAAQRADFRKSARDHVESTFKNAANGDLNTNCLITCERIGDEQVFFHHSPGGMRAVSRVSAKQVDDCLAWQISMVATGLFGLLSLFDVPTSSGSISKIMNKLIGKSTKLATAFGQALEGTINAAIIVEFVNILSDNGYLWTFVNDILDSLSYWDFLFFVGEVGIELLGLLVPEAELVIIFAKLAAAVVQLLVVYSQKPSGC